LQAGEAPQMIVNVSSGFTSGGVTRGEWRDDFVSKTPAALRDRIHICHIVGDSTDTESEDVRHCLANNHLQDVRSILLVTSATHTRRALAIFSRRLPRYRWSVAAAPDVRLQQGRWSRAEVVAGEYAKLLWWNVLRRWV